MDQFSFTSKWEGIYPFLYLDSKGIMTCGVGFRVYGREDLKRFPWDRLIAAQADYVEVERLGPGHTLTEYHLVTAARLSYEGMQQMFENEVLGVRSELQRAGWKLQNHPVPVQIAIIDLAYNLGMHGIEKFKRFRAAIDARDYGQAAIESHRKDVQEARNVATAELLRSAAGVA